LSPRFHKFRRGDLVAIDSKSPTLQLLRTQPIAGSLPDERQRARFDSCFRAEVIANFQAQGPRMTGRSFTLSGLFFRSPRRRYF
jgi:hypothetical protein